MGATLAGHVLENAIGRSYESITRDQIFAPLGMEPTEWATGPVAGVPNAVPYIDYRPTPPDEYPMLTPSGALRTNVLALARFLQIFMQGGTRDGVRILGGASVAGMRRPQVPQIDDAMDLFWYYKRGYLGHAGGLAGTAS